MESRERAAELFRDAAQPTDEARDRLLRGLADRDLLVRLIAAIEIAKRWAGDLPETSIREMLELLARDEYFDRFPLQDDFAAATATEEDCGSLGQDIVVAFAHLGCGQADFVIHRLLEFWSFDSQFYELGHAMLALAFPFSDRARARTELSGLQRRILQALVAQPIIWTSDMTWGQALTRHGLPGTLSDMLRLLGYQQ